MTLKYSDIQYMTYNSIPCNSLGYSENLDLNKTLFLLIKSELVIKKMCYLLWLNSLLTVSTLRYQDFVFFIDFLLIIIFINFIVLSVVISSSLPFPVTALFIGLFYCLQFSVFADPVLFAVGCFLNSEKRCMSISKFY